ncbi:MAG: hypothetical protein AABZ30_05590 [Myxococcota bacterium]
MITASFLAVLVQATAQSPLADDFAVARAAALDEALRRCVVAAAAGVRPGATPPSAELLAKARSYIESHRIVAEVVVGDHVEITIEADVAEGRLARALGAGATGGDAASTQPEAPAYDVRDEGAVRGTGLVAARARGRHGYVDDVDVWGFGPDAASARGDAEARARGPTSPAGFDLVVTGVDGPAVLAHLRDALADRVPGVTSASLRRAGQGRFDLRIEATRAPAEIAAALAALELDGFHLELRRVDGAVRMEVVSP